MQGRVLRVWEAKVAGEIEGEDGRTFQFDASDLERTEAERPLPGTKVEFTVATPEASGGPLRGLRATRVRILGAGDAAEAIPQGGDASGTGTGQPVGMQPTPEVEQDKVDEASWESFPASDPPAYTRAP